ncbi:hypothetical protein [Halomicrobium katesii]|uniref:hypothetical protein n=1 Tax=Halomicrobium katesii TaxID=437163 RepID=UPI0012BADCD4|nr:hypothetical protein [Halomicrobium katesii]
MVAKYTRRSAIKKSVLITFCSIGVTGSGSASSRREVSIESSTDNADHTFEVWFDDTDVSVQQSEGSSNVETRENGGQEYGVATGTLRGKGNDAETNVYTVPTDTLIEEVRAFDKRIQITTSNNSDSQSDHEGRIEFTDEGESYCRYSFSAQGSIDSSPANNLETGFLGDDYESGIGSVDDYEDTFDVIGQITDLTLKPYNDGPGIADRKF